MPDFVSSRAVTNYNKFDRTLQNARGLLLSHLRSSERSLRSSKKTWHGNLGEATNEWLKTTEFVL